MSFPFSPHTSFTDDATPAIGADFLMAMQSEGVNPAAAVAWKVRPRISAKSTDGSTVVLGASVVMCLDATTAKYGYATLAGQNITTANLDSGSSWANATWYYAYAVLDNGTPSVEVSATGPDGERLIKTADSTRKYLFSFYSDSGGNLSRFVREGFETRWLDRIYLHGTEGGGVASFSTVGIAHSLATAAPPHAAYVDVWLYLTSGGTAFTYTLSYYGDSGAQVRWPLGSNQNYVWAQKVATNGDTFLFSDVSNDATAYGWVRILGWEE